jgi:hypothetical protein
VKLTAHLHLTLRIRKSGAIPQLPHTSSWRGAWLITGDNFNFTLTGIRDINAILEKLSK